MAAPIIVRRISFKARPIMRVAWIPCPGMPNIFAYGQVRKEERKEALEDGGSIVSK